MDPSVMASAAGGQVHLERDVYDPELVERKLPFQLTCPLSRNVSAHRLLGVFPARPSISRIFDPGGLREVALWTDRDAPLGSTWHRPESRPSGSNLAGGLPAPNRGTFATNRSPKSGSG